MSLYFYGTVPPKIEEALIEDSYYFFISSVAKGHEDNCIFLNKGERYLLHAISLWRLAGRLDKAEQLKQFLNEEIKVDSNLGPDETFRINTDQSKRLLEMITGIEEAFGNKIDESRHINPEYAEELLKKDEFKLVRAYDREENNPDSLYYTLSEALSGVNVVRKMLRYALELDRMVFLD
jgi:hypothetical protein